MFFFLNRITAKTILTTIIFHFAIKSQLIFLSVTSALLSSFVQMLRFSSFWSTKIQCGNTFDFFRHNAKRKYGFKFTPFESQSHATLVLDVHLPRTYSVCWSLEEEKTLNVPTIDRIAAFWSVLQTHPWLWALLWTLEHFELLKRRSRRLSFRNAAFKANLNHVRWPIMWPFCQSAETLFLPKCKFQACHHRRSAANLFRLIHTRRPHSHPS